MAINKLNLAHWNEVTPQHVTSPLYRTEDFKRGENVLDSVARKALGDVAGKKLLHLQCHFGLDTLSLTRMGAIATGLDFSDVAIETARALAKETDTKAKFVVSDVLNPPANLKGFDIVFASWGAIYWIGDLERWMQVAANALKKGGKLVLCEGHPVVWMLDDQAKKDAPFTVAFPYDSDKKHVDEGEATYAGAKVKANRTEGYLHGLARIFNAAMKAGLTIRGFEEGDRIPWQALPQLKPLDKEFWGLPKGTPFFPLSYSLTAVKEGRG